MFRHKNIFCGSTANHWSNVKLSFIMFKSERLRNMGAKVSIDRTDYAIMALLQENAWISNKEIAGSVNLSISATAGRVKRLKDDGILQSAHSVVDGRVMGVRLEALFLIQLDKHDQDIVGEFMQEALMLPEVRSIYLITGPYDIVANVVARDTDHLKTLAFKHFTNRSYITRIETSIVYNSLISRVLNPLT